METLPDHLIQSAHEVSPHSLGKLIEWKPAATGEEYIVKDSPHSLGKLIEWKRIDIYIRLE